MNEGHKPIFDNLDSMDPPGEISETPATVGICINEDRYAQTITGALMEIGVSSVVELINKHNELQKNYTEALDDGCAIANNNDELLKDGLALSDYIFQQMKAGKGTPNNSVYDAMVRIDGRRKEVEKANPECSVCGKEVGLTNRPFGMDTCYECANKDNGEPK